MDGAMDGDVSGRKLEHCPVRWNTPPSSCPGLTRASTPSSVRLHDVGGRVKPGRNALNMIQLDRITL